MMKRIVAIAAVLCACFCLGAAQAQDRPEIFPQLGHSGGINSVAFSPDGRTLVSGSNDHTIKLWVVASGRELRTLRGHSNTVSSVAFSPDGRVLASGSGDHTVKLWDVTSGRELRTLSGHSDLVRSVTFSPDGHTLASGSDDNTIKLWDVATGRELRTLRGNSSGTVAFSPDGRILASGNNRTVKLWDMTSGRELHTIAGQPGAVEAVAFSPDGRMLATGNIDISASGIVTTGTVNLWDVASGRALRTVGKTPTSISSLAFSPDGRLLVFGSWDNTVTLWTVASGRELHTFGGHTSWVQSVAFSPNGRILASGSEDQTIRLWDVTSGRELRTLSRHTAWVGSVAYSSDGRIVAAGNQDGAIELWNAANGRLLRVVAGHSGVVTSVAISPDGRILASARRLDQTVKLWDIATGSELRSLSGHSKAVNSVAFSPDGHILASGSDDETVKLWDVGSGREVRTLSAHSIAVNSIAFSPNGRTLAAGCNDRNNTIELWDLSSGTELRSFTTPEPSDASPFHLQSVADMVREMINLLHTGVGSIAFSPDGRTVVSGSKNGTTQLWDVASGEVRTLTGQSSGVSSVAFSRDGRVVVSGSWDGTIKFWDATSGHDLRTLGGHAVSVESLAVAPDGRWFASGNDDGTVRIWDVGSGSERVSFVAFTDGSYLAITPEGYYDASSEQAEENLNVRLGNRVFPVAAYRDKFYRPDLVRLSLAGRSLKELGFAGIDSVKVAPIVELVDVPSSTHEPKLTVNVRITDAGGGIGQVRLYLNGTAVVQESAAASLPRASLTRSYTVQLVDGANVLQAEAYNAENSMHASSPIAKVPANLPPATRASLHALVVGIQEFENPDLALTYSVNDARLFADTLKKYSAPLFQHVDIKLLTAPAETTRDRLMQALKDIKAAIGPDDLFVFYVASHGEVDDGEYYLITSNVGSVSTERLKKDAVSKEELIALVANIPATKKLMVIDTCHAEALGNALQLGLATRGLDAITALKILSRSVGTIMLSASTSTQEALEGYKEHGLFTYVVAEGLMGNGDADKSGFVSTLGLAHYVEDQVPEIAKREFNRKQYPTVQMNGQEFPLTKVR